MIRLEDVLKTFKRLEDVLKMSWRPFCKTSWKRLENVLKTSWEDVLKTSWRRLGNVLKTSWRRAAKTNILVLTKTSSEDVRLRRRYSSWSRRLQDVLWRRRRKTSSRRLQDVFITNGCWDVVWKFVLFYSFHRAKTCLR